MIQPSSSSPPATRRAVVVLGMHRSGTSAVAGCLQRLGVDFGPRLMPATSANARGYYEHIDIVNLHDRLLLALDSGWDEILPLPADWAKAAVYREELLALLRRDFGGSALWGVKDPRLCRLLPWWEPLWGELGVAPLFLIVLRSPAEVAASLVRREGFSPAKAHLLWLQSLLEAERCTRGQPRVLLDFESVLADASAALAPVKQVLGRSWPVPAETPGADQAHFLDAGLRHKIPDESAPLPALVKLVEKALRDGLSGREAQMRAALDRAGEGLRQAAELYQPLLISHPADLAGQLQGIRRLTRWYEAEWQKARGRLAAAARRAAASTKASEKRAKRIIEKEENTSFVRIHILSKTRKRGSFWSSFWRKKPSDQADN